MQSVGYYFDWKVWCWLHFIIYCELQYWTTVVGTELETEKQNSFLFWQNPKTKCSQKQRYKEQLINNLINIILNIKIPESLHTFIFYKLFRSINKPNHNKLFIHFIFISAREFLRFIFQFSIRYFLLFLFFCKPFLFFLSKNSLLNLVVNLAVS